MLHKFTDILEIINKEVEKLHFIGEPRSLFEPIEYILSLGGKRVRPALSLMSYNMYKDDVGQALPVAMAIEIFHNFTLLHDDLMDNADVRRGEETVHVKWNENVAVLSGDAMLIEAYKEVAKTESPHFKEILCRFSKMATEICCGQQYDMEFEKRMDVSIDEYLEMIRLKTAVLLGCALQEGAIIAGASKEDSDALYDFGINIGLAFQLVDDLLDVYGDPQTFGKRIGGDILCNKKTFLSINALQDEQKGAELITWINKTDFDPDEKIKAVTVIYDDLNLKDISNKLIYEYYKKGLACLDRVKVGEDKKNELRQLASYLLSRTS